MEVFAVRGLPTFVPFILAFTSLIIDPVTEGSFYYYTLSTFAFRASKLQNEWALRDVAFQLSVSALFGLTLLFLACFSLLAIFRGKITSVTLEPV
jgi:hypothetical protein